MDDPNSSLDLWSSGKNKSLLSEDQMADEIEEDYDDESISERIIALSEMFPDSVRNAVSSVIGGSIEGTKWLMKTSRIVTWVVVSSASILVLPIMFESERAQMEEQHLQQQRQMLLGPNVAVSGHHMGYSPGIMQQMTPQQT